MRCETCTFDLPDDWPATEVVLPATEVLPQKTVRLTLCAPCARKSPDHGAAMTPYHALPPHVPAGARKEMAS